MEYSESRRKQCSQVVLPICGDELRGLTGYEEHINMTLGFELKSVSASACFPLSPPEYLFRLTPSSFVGTCIVRGMTKEAHAFW